MKLFLVFGPAVLFCIICSSVNAQTMPAPQAATVTQHTRVTMRHLPLDTNQLVYDEAGNGLRYYQVEKLMNTGEYKITFDGPPGQPQTKQHLQKITQQQQIAAYEKLKTFLQIETPNLKEGSPFDIMPLLPAVNKQDLDNKVIVIVFWDAGCPPCTESFDALNNFFAQINNPENITILAITGDAPAVAEAKLKEKPLKHAQLVCFGSNINAAYGIKEIPAFVVVDRDHMVRLAIKGSSAISVALFKNIIRQVLYQ